MLESASAKIDRFGWSRMDGALKDQLCADWCDRLSKYTLNEVRRGIAGVFEVKRGEIKSINEFQVEAAIKAEHSRIIALLPKAPETSDPPRKSGTAKERAEYAQKLVRHFVGEHRA